MNFYFSLNIDKINMHTMSFVSNVCASEWASWMCLCVLLLCFFLFHSLVCLVESPEWARTRAKARERQKTSKKRHEHTPNSHTVLSRCICKIVIKANGDLHDDTQNVFFFFISFRCRRLASSFRSSVWKFCSHRRCERKQNTRTKENEDFSLHFFFYLCLNRHLI